MSSIDKCSAGTWTTYWPSSPSLRSAALHGPPRNSGYPSRRISHTVRTLEERLGLRLLTRTTRSVAPTEAGERLLRGIGPRFEEIEAELGALSELREKPAGTIRLTATDYAADTILWPKLMPFLRRYPDIKVEIIIDYGLTDIVFQRFDAGVRIGNRSRRT
jgi:DNA-binding transcriptional LysR family regulator